MPGRPARKLNLFTPLYHTTTVYHTTADTSYAFRHSGNQLVTVASHEDSWHCFVANQDKNAKATQVHTIFAACEVDWLSDTALPNL